MLYILFVCYSALKQIKTNLCVGANIAHMPTSHTVGMHFCVNIVKRFKNKLSKCCRLIP